jgi:Fe-S cluster assembly scaffold protein SufB
MKPEQKIKHLIIKKTYEWMKKEVPDITSENIDEFYEEMEEQDEHWDAMSEIRELGIETKIPCENSRHYESKSVAAQALDGTWVGWTYWYGGGKHGQPEDIEWMDEAYDLDVKEKQRVTTHRTFTKK